MIDARASVPLIQGEGIGVAGLVPNPPHDATTERYVVLNHLGIRCIRDTVEDVVLTPEIICKILNDRDEWDCPDRCEWVHDTGEQCEAPAMPGKRVCVEHLLEASK